MPNDDEDFKQYVHTCKENKIDGRTDVETDSREDQRALWYKKINIYYNEESRVQERSLQFAMMTNRIRNIEWSWLNWIIRATVGFLKSGAVKFTENMALLGNTQLPKCEE